MKKLFFQWVLILSIGIFKTSYTQNAAQIYTKIVNSTVTVETEDALGSGFFVDENLIVTNYHVIEGSDKAFCYSNNSYSKYTIEGYVAVDIENDLILLKVIDLNRNPIRFATVNPTPGQSIYVLGSPKGLPATISDGIISGLRDFGGRKLIQITAPISHGSSGGPVLNSNGELIGVSVGQFSEGQNLNFAIPKSNIELLLSFKNAYSMPLSNLLRKFPISYIDTNQIGTIQLWEKFSENDRGWNLGSDNNVIRSIENGKMKLECKKYEMYNGTFKGKGGYWIRLPDLKLPSNNYSVSVTTRWIKNMKTNDTYSPYGLILGDYYFLIYADGDRRLLKFNTVDKKYETIVNWGVSSAINKKGSADNKLEIRVTDGKAAFYANGQMLFKKEVSIPDATSVKLYVENSEVVTFDDLIVKTF
ncbi:MAG: trypsin-like peptidase domain-containing protein [Chitinophagaceae bacterium]|nr:trypsin-like peptidase domain-containing protein [Chitinophagaceae bacterium]